MHLLQLSEAISHCSKRFLISLSIQYKSVPGGSAVKNTPAMKEMGSIPGSERSPGERNGNPLQFLAWEIPWTEEPGELQPMGSQRAGHNLATEKQQPHMPISIFNHFIRASGDTERMYRRESQKVKKKEGEVEWCLPGRHCDVFNFSILYSLLTQMVKCLPTVRKTQVRSVAWEDSLEKEMATHSSILAWEIPWTEDPSRLQSMGSQRFGHN